MEFIGQLGHNWYHAQSSSKSIGLSPDGNIVALTGLNYDTKIGIYDVSDPANIKELSQWGGEGLEEGKPYIYYHDVEFINQDTIAIAAGANGVNFIDVSDPSNPEFITQWDTESIQETEQKISPYNNIHKIEVHSDGDELLIFDKDYGEIPSDYGLQLLDISDINNPSLIWSTGENNEGSEAVDGIYYSIDDNGSNDYAIQSTGHTLKIFSLDEEIPEEIYSQDIFIDDEEFGFIDDEEFGDTYINNFKLALSDDSSTLF